MTRKTQKRRTAKQSREPHPTQFTDQLDHELTAIGPKRGRRWKSILAVVLLILAGFLLYRSIDTYQRRSLAWQASQARQAGLWRQLEDVSLRWAEKEPKLAMPWLLAAEAAEQTGKTSQMAQYLENVPADDPRAPDILLDVATIYFGELNQPEKAVELLKQALVVKPDFAEAHRRLMFYYGITVQRTKMAEIARQAINREADRLETYVYLIGANWLTFSNAYELNHKWAQSDKNIETYVVGEAIHWRGTASSSQQGEALSDVERDQILNERHAEILAKQLELYPENRELLAYFLERESVRGNTDRVQELLSRVPRTAANDNRFWHYKGWFHAARGETDEALLNYRKALELNPYSWRTQFELADVLRKRGEFTEVERLSNLAIVGKALQKTILQLPDVQSVPLDVFKEMQQYAEDCGDDATAGLMKSRLIDLASQAE